MGEDQLTEARLRAWAEDLANEQIPMALLGRKLLAQELRRYAKAWQAEVERLRAYVRDQLCDCYDEYGKRRPQKCNRCRLLDSAESAQAAGTKGGA